MKRIKLLILLLLILPITVMAKTPNKEETLKIIEKIENIQVDDNTYIKNISILDDRFILNLEENENIINKDIYYEFKDNELSFYSENISLDLNNNYAFYLYLILENKSTIPYDIDNYYNNSNIKEKINIQKEIIKTYIEDTKTFGITIKKDNELKVIYHYYFDGDYPIIEKEQISTDEFTNPNTRNYSIIITIMLISVTIIGVYTYFDKSTDEGENA